MKSTVKKPTIERLPSGSYRTRLMIDGKRASITGDSVREVTARYYAMMASGQIQKKQERDPESMTVGEAIDSYIDKRRVSCSASTVRGYVTIKNNAFPSLVDRIVSRITDADCQKAINIEARTHSGKTVINSWSLFSAAMKDVCGRDVNVHLPPVIRHEHEFLTAEQIPAFLDAINGEKVELAALLGLHSLRRSEIADLRIGDIDIERNIIHVRGSAVYDEHQKLIHKETNKTSNSRRDVPIMIPRLAELVRCLPPGTDYIVQLAPNTVQRSIDRICERNGLPKIGCHGLRHSFASLALHVGMKPDIAMRLGGWDDLNTMKRIYTHVSKADLNSAAEVMANFYK